METVTVDFAKAHLDDLLERANRGEPIVIASPKGAAFALKPLQGWKDRQRPKAGNWKGRIAVPARLMEPGRTTNLRGSRGRRRREDPARYACTILVSRR